MSQPFPRICLAFVAFFTFFMTTIPVVNAANLSLKSSTKLGVTRNCGSWNIVSSPTVNGIFTGVAPVSSKSVWAIGSYSGFSQTLIEHWNGTQWNIVPSPSPGLYYNDLRGVAVVSASSVWTVGSYGNSSGIPQTLIEHWHLGKWSVISSPNPGSGSNYLYGVTALSANDITAVGLYFNADPNLPQALIEHWNGKKWSVISSPNIPSVGNYLNGVSALLTNNIWAVGVRSINNAQQTLIEHWDGISWSVVPSPNLSNYNALYQVSALSTNDIWAVGAAIGSTLVEHWDGTSWSIIASPSPGAGANGLNGVTALSSTNVWAVGSAQTGNNGMPQTLIEHWDGTSWSVIPSPNLGMYNNTLNAVARVSYISSQVWTVGSYNDNNNVGQTLTEFYC